MQVKDLSKELGIQNKDLITYLKENGFKVSSHMQAVNDDMIDLARAHFAIINEKEEVIEEKTTQTSVKQVEEAVVTRKFEPNDMIPCKSVVSWKINELGSDRNTVYHWEYFGDVDYIKYSDLQNMRRKDVITKPKILIQDANLCYQWRRELGDIYKYYLNVDYPEDFFELSDEKFEELLTSAPDVLKDVIKITARVMINNENYPSLNKINSIDRILGTCMKEFL